MSVFATVIGNLGRDAELKQDKKGRSFVSFTIGTDDFIDGKQETTWVNVMTYSERIINLVERGFLKKGSSVVIYGNESVRIYTSTVDGQPKISRDVIAERVDFVRGGKRNDETTSQSQQTQPQTQPQNVTTQATQNLSQDMFKINIPNIAQTNEQQEDKKSSHFSFAASSSVEDDDLPF